MRTRRLRTIYSMIALGALAAARVDSAPAGPSPEDQVLKHLGETIDWYRRVAALEQTPLSTEELLFQDSVRQSARLTLQQAFGFARAQAAVLAVNPKMAATAPSGSQAARLSQAAIGIAQKVIQLQHQLDLLDQELASASPETAPALRARRDEAAAELNLANARREILQTWSSIADATGTSGGLSQKIDELERSVPEAQVASVNASTTQRAVETAAASQQIVRPESAGIVGLISEMFTLSHKINDVNLVGAQTASLQQSLDAVRMPIRTQLKEAIARSESLTAATAPSDIARLNAQRQDLDALTTRFRQLAAAGLPLGAQAAYLDATHANLVQWKNALDRDYERALRSLLVRLTAMGAAIIILLVISFLWKRATFRYVSDVRRRRQFLFVRRLVVGGVLILILVASVITEFGSLATYAGLLTAGIAVALQTVILSGVAHMFFIGRYGVRVGDRVTISGITGDVIDIGIFRMYLAELAGTNHQLEPTGRIVVFSNSVLFQPSAFFKQLPGADYSWHEVALTLSPEGDYKLAETRLLGAVAGVYEGYRKNIEQQYTATRDSLRLQATPPKPEGRFRFVNAVLEFAVRYPVENNRAAEIDDQVTRKLLETIDAEPTLRLVATSPPTIQPAKAV